MTTHTMRITTVMCKGDLNYDVTYHHGTVYNMVITTIQFLPWWVLLFEFPGMTLMRELPPWILWKDEHHHKQGRNNTCTVKLKCKPTFKHDNFYLLMHYHDTAYRVTHPTCDTHVIHQKTVSSNDTWIKKVIFFSWTYYLLVYYHDDTTYSVTCLP